MCVNVLLACIYVCMCVQYSWRSEEGMGSLGCGVLNSFDQPGRYLDLNPSLLQEQVSLTTKLSLQALFAGFQKPLPSVYPFYRMRLIFISWFSVAL